VKAPRKAGTPLAPSLVTRTITAQSELDLDRFAGGFERAEIELDADSDFLAEQVFGYSP